MPRQGIHSRGPWAATVHLVVVLLVSHGPGEVSVPPMKRSAGWLTWVALALITLGAAALRLIHIGQVPPDPFYDAAVRSMGLSWHNFFFGAFEPGGSVSIDKPPVDLWLQVASVKLIGFSNTSLKLPEALAGTLAVPLLFGPCGACGAPARGWPRRSRRRSCRSR